MCKCDVVYVCQCGVVVVVVCKCDVVYVCQCGGGGGVCVSVMSSMCVSVVVVVVCVSVMFSVCSCVVLMVCVFDVICV